MNKQTLSANFCKRRIRANTACKNITSEDDDDADTLRKENE